MVMYMRGLTWIVFFFFFFGDRNPIGFYMVCARARMYVCVEITKRCRRSDENFIEFQTE